MSDEEPETPPAERSRHVELRGIGVSPGYAIGRSFLVDRRKLRVPKYHVSPGEIESELERFERALRESEQQLADIKDKLTDAGENYYLILDAHQLMIRDEMLVEGTRQMIRDQAINADWALKKVVKSIKAVFDDIDDEYFRERRSDVDFVGDRILRNLMGTAQPSLSVAHTDSLLVAHDLSPSDTAYLLKTPVLGFVTEVGGKTSHTAIMARSLELPAVVGVDGATEVVGAGDMIVVDGNEGVVLVNPPLSEVRRYQRLQMEYTRRRAELDRSRHDAATTRDGTTIRIAGNIELSEETDLVLDHGAEGVGLFRTEYLYMNRDGLPDEEEQYQHYRTVLERCGAGGATIRTLDLGGDKLITPMRAGNTEMNPVMGLRAIRFCLKTPAVFRAQLRALLRASVHGQLRILVPLVSGLDEVREVKRLLADCREEVVREGHRVADEIALGVMIEIPSAAVIADLLAKEVDFFAIGTNDLIQYTLAIDRANEDVAHLYRPLHPALVRMISSVVAAAQAEGIRVSVCGEMAGDAFYTAVLLGMGLTELSMNSSSISLVKSVIRALDLDDCRALFDEIRDMHDLDRIESHVATRMIAMLADRVPTDLVLPPSHRTPRPATEPFN